MLVKKSQFLILLHLTCFLTSVQIRRRQGLIEQGRGQRQGPRPKRRRQGLIEQGRGQRQGPRPIGERSRFLISL